MATRTSKLPFNQTNKKSVTFFSAFSWQKIDYVLFMLMLMLLAFSLVMVYTSSIDYGNRYGSITHNFFVKKTAMIMAGSLVVFCVCLHISMDFWKNLSYLLIGFALFLLFLVLIIGGEINGAKRWIPLGFINFQPAELAKLAIIVYAASYVERKIRSNDTENFLLAVVPMGVVVGFLSIFLYMEPDLGSVIVIVSVAFVILSMGGVKLTGLLVTGLLAFGLFMSSLLLTPWRKERFLAFLDPWSTDHALGKGYQLTHSLISLGRGEIFGVGLGLGVEKFNWLPEAHTDFIFAVIGEELGLIGVALLVFIYWIIILRMTKIGSVAVRRDEVFSGLVVFGIASWFAIQAIFHMGVNLGLLPTKGITLPMVSYGGSGLIFNLLALALVFRVNHENQLITK